MSLVLVKQHSPKIIDGKAIAQSVLDEVKSDVERYTAQGVEPCLAVVLVGEDPASQVYVRNKVQKQHLLGFVH